MEKDILNFVQSNSPDGGFLQSVYWRKFQEMVGRKTHDVLANKESSEPAICANIIEHTLPLVGKYFYIPRGPVIETKNYSEEIKTFFSEILALAGKNDVGWIRIEPASEKALSFIRENIPENMKIKKSSVDMQPREVLIADISKSEEEILAGMKQKTRYNIKLANKRGVKIITLREKKYVDELLRLVKITAKRDKIVSHPENYYRKMLEIIPSDILKLYVAEYEGKIIAANLVLFFGRTATYMHGASDNENRSAMAPYLLQWRQIQDAKKVGCGKYDFGGVDQKKWPGVTRFKQGFAPNTDSVKFPGSYDIILTPARYNLYRTLQKIKKIFRYGG